MIIYCTKCKSKFDVEPGRAGEEAACGACGVVFTIPSPNELKHEVNNSRKNDYIFVSKLMSILGVLTIIVGIIGGCLLFTISIWYGIIAIIGSLSNSLILIALSMLLRRNE